MTPSNNKNVAIIGAGMAGLTAAETLANAGVPVTIFDKGRGPGGRMRTHRGSPCRFDYGAQYFTVRGGPFREAVVHWQAQGIAATWKVQPVILNKGKTSATRHARTRYVGAPDMSALIAALAAPHDVRFSTHVSGMRRTAERWALVAEGGDALGEFDIVLVATPPPQAADLLAPLPLLAGTVRAIPMLPCWAVMATFDRLIDVSFDAAFVQASSLGWIARNTSKPKRPDAECWVFHGAAQWSLDHIDATPESVREDLLRSLSRAADVSVPPPTFVRAHRWMFAIAEAPLGEDCLWEPKSSVGVCGDWCLGTRVEEAFTSGRAVAAAVLRELGRR